MTVSRMLVAAFFALAAGIAVENAKAKGDCTGSAAMTSACIAVHVAAQAAPAN